MEIKPIETHYNGYRFRSRLEARWAVFFDAAGIKYEYEPEGFVIESYGVAYLPDFFLPRFKTYVEIKRGNLPEEEMYKIEDKCEMFQVENPEYAMLLCYGDPVDMRMRIYYDSWEEELSRYLPRCNDAFFIEGPGWWVPEIHPSGKMSLVEECHCDNDVFIAVGHSSDECVEQTPHPFLIHLCTIRHWRSFLESARSKARSARFEHGEKP